MRVLLVSGEPHAGERVWRNLLKADPSVDLVHFTILRPPDKQDGTPIQQLSLIAEELFVNLVTYGTAPSSSQARFALSADCRSVCLEMLDCGGLRFYLIRNSAEKTEYSRAAGHNFHEIERTKRQWRYRLASE